MKDDVVVGLGRAIHAARDLQQLLALVLVRALGPGAAEQALDLAPHLEHQQLIARIDVGDENALARQYGNQAFARQPLQAFADRRPADLEHGRQHLLREDVAGLEPQRDDLLLDQSIGLLGQRRARRAAAPALRRGGLPSAGTRLLAMQWPASAPCQTCFRFATMAANFSYSASFTV